MKARSRRSVLVTPADKRAMFETAAASGADVVFLDLEDAIVPCAKDVARATAIEGLISCDWGGIERAVRINSLATAWAHDDIISIVSGAREELDTIILPKVSTGREVWWLDVLLSQLETKLGLNKQVRLQAMIESVAGLINVEEIARSSPRLDSLHFGVGDFAVSQGARVGLSFKDTAEYPGDIWHYARSKVLVAARAAGIEAIDAAYPAYRDEDGYQRSAKQAAMLGYGGKLAVHPDQVPLANQAFSPSDDEVAQAREYLDAYRNAAENDQGTVGVEGSLVDAVHVRLAEQILSRRSKSSSPDHSMNDQQR